MSFMELAEARYSVRKFTDKPVEKEELDAILRAGRIAPVGSRKIPEIKPFCGHQSTCLKQAHCIKDRVLLDETCGSGGLMLLA